MEDSIVVEAFSIFLLTVFLIRIDGVEADLLVVLLEGSEVLAGLGKLTFLHALADVPGCDKEINNFLSLNMSKQA
jgi:hypothetical protein